MKKSVIFVLSLLLLAVFASTSLAVEVSLYGPQQFVRTEGEPNVYTDSFTVVGLSGQGRLVITNGDPSGEHRISSAIVHFNGQQVCGTSDFSQEVSEIVIPVDLQETNDLSVELRSGPGSYLTVQVVHQLQDDQAMLSY